MQTLNVLPGLALLGALLILGLEAQPAGSATSKDQCTTAVTDGTSSDSYLIPASAFKDGNLTFNIKAQGGDNGLVFLMPETMEWPIYYVDMGNSISIFYRSEGTPEGHMATYYRLAENMTRDVLSEEESRDYTISIAKDGTVSLAQRDHGILLQGKDENPFSQPMHSVRFWSPPGKVTWKFGC